MNSKNRVQLMEKLKTESDMAIYILKSFNEETNLSYLKIAPLYFIASKSKELMRDRMFWLMLSAITVANRIVPLSSKHRDLCIIAHCVSRLPNLSWVSE